MSKENVELVQRSIDAYNRRDFDAMRAISDPDMEVDWSASRGLEAGIYRGVEEVMRFYENFLGTFDEVDLVPDRFMGSGDSVVVPNAARIRGRDGIETVARSTLVFEVRSGLITHIRLYQETQEALQAVGLQEHAGPNRSDNLS
jgi:ketosteroid isomerase-like protein